MQRMREDEHEDLIEQWLEDLRKQLLETEDTRNDAFLKELEDKDFLQEMQDTDFRDNVVEDLASFLKDLEDKGFFEAEQKKAQFTKTDEENNRDPKSEILKDDTETELYSDETLNKILGHPEGKGMSLKEYRDTIIRDATHTRQEKFKSPGQPAKADYHKGTSENDLETQNKNMESKLTSSEDDTETELYNDETLNKILGYPEGKGISLKEYRDTIIGDATLTRHEKSKSSGRPAKADYHKGTSENDLKTQNKNMEPKLTSSEVKDDTETELYSDETLNKILGYQEGKGMSLKEYRDMISGDADRKSDDNDRTRTSVRDKQANANQTGQDGLKAYKDMISHSDIKNGAQANETNQFSYQMSNDGEMHGGKERENKPNAGQDLWDIFRKLCPVDPNMKATISDDVMLNIGNLMKGKPDLFDITNSMKQLMKHLQDSGIFVEDSTQEVKHDVRSGLNTKDGSEDMEKKPPQSKPSVPKPAGATVATSPDDSKPNSKKATSSPFTEQNLPEEQAMTSFLPPDKGLYNFGNSCYMNSTLQAIFRTPKLARAIAEMKDLDHQGNGCTICPLKGTYNQMMFPDDKSFISPFRMWSIRSDVNASFSSKEQQDAQEYLLSLITRVNEYSGLTEHQGSNLSEYFEAETVQSITCSSCKAESRTRHMNAVINIPIPLESINTIQEGIEKYFNGGEENMLNYKCEKCSYEGESPQKNALVKPPEVLMVQLRRFHFLQNTNRTVKSSNSIDCSEEIRVAKDDGSHIKYALRAVIHHQGDTIDSGHYTTVVRSNKQYVWYDDNRVKRIYRPKRSSTAYIAIYEAADFETQAKVESHAEAQKKRNVKCLWSEDEEISLQQYKEMLNREAGSTDTKVKHFAELDNQTERGSADSINQDPLFEFNHPENESLTEDTKDTDKPIESSDTESNYSIKRTEVHYSTSDDEEDFSSTENVSSNKAKPNSSRFETPEISSNYESCEEYGEDNMNNKQTSSQIASTPSPEEFRGGLDSDISSRAKSTPFKNIDGSVEKDPSQRGKIFSAEERGLNYTDIQTESENKHGDKYSGSLNDAECINEDEPGESNVHIPETSNRKIVYTTKHEIFSTEEVIKLLKDANKGTLNGPIITLPPYAVKGGDVYIYQLQKPDDRDYLRDQITGFELCGTYLNKAGMRKSYYKVREYSKVVEGTRKKNYLPGFEKHTYILDDKKYKYVLIHYLGDESIHKARPHGNDKRGKLFVSNTQKAKDDIKAGLKIKAQPKHVYNENVRKAEEMMEEKFENLGDVVSARNTKQVRNIKYSEALKGRLVQCELFSMYYMGLTEYGEMFHAMELLPHEIHIISDPAALNFANQLLKESMKNPGLDQLLSYDTTFDLTDSYVSTLVMRNIYLEKSPIFPVAYMMHNVKKSAVHRTFWVKMDEALKLGKYVDKIVFTMDRETSFAKELRRQIPGASIVFCHNHILTDVKVWIKKHGGKSDDIKALTAQVKILLDCTSEIEFDDKYERYRDEWSQSYVRYIERYVKNDMKSSAKFTYSRYKAFENILPTNNISESLNAMIKRQTEFKELPKDTLALALHQLQLEKLSNFKRSYGASGDYTPKSEFAKSYSQIELPAYAHISQEKFINIFRGIKDDINNQERPDISNTNRTLAEICLDEGLVTVESKSRTFIVRAPYTNKRYDLYFDEDTNKLDCSCPSTTVTCYHKLAVLKLMAIDGKPKRKPEYRLSELQMKQRQAEGIGRSGRRRPRPKDEDLIVIPAPDSLVAGVFGMDDQERETFHDDKQKKKTKKRKTPKPLEKQTPKNSNETYKPPDDVSKKNLSSHSGAFDDVLNENVLNETNINDQKVSEKNINSKLNTSLDNADKNEIDNSNNSQKKNQESSSKSELHTSALSIEVVDLKESGDEFELASGGQLIEKYDDLMDGQLIRGSTLANAIEKIIYTAGLDESIYAPDPSLEEVARNSNFKELITRAAKLELYNYDTLLQQMCTDSETHYILGGIVFSDKIIFIMDSLNTSIKDRKQDFITLLKIAMSCAWVADDEIKASDWKFIYCNNTPKQDNAFDCGLYCASNVYSIVNCKKFKDIPFSNSSEGRGWMKNILMTGKLPPRRPRNKHFIPPKNMDSLVQKMTQLDKINIKATKKDLNKTLKINILNLRKGWTTCGFEKCKKDPEHKEPQGMCVSCRKWFHISCEELQSLKFVPFYSKCADCYIEKESLDDLCQGSENFQPEQELVTEHEGIPEADVTARFSLVESCEEAKLDDALQAIRPELDTFYERHLRGDTGPSEAAMSMIYLPKPFSHPQVSKMFNYIQQYITEKIETTADASHKSKIPFFVKTAHALVPPMVYGNLTGRSLLDSLLDFLNQKDQIEKRNEAVGLMTQKLVEGLTSLERDANLDT